MKPFIDQYGIRLVDSHFQIRFGNASFSRDNLLVELNDNSMELRELNQVHGHLSVKADVGLQRADAHWTDEINRSLLIKTADCMPIFVVDEATPRVLAIHAGWRGVENQITMKAIQDCFPTFSDSLRVIVGPHIGFQSFVVDSDVAQKLEMAIPTNFRKNLSEIFHPSGEKIYIDLLQILERQMESLGISKSKVISFPIDTQQSTDWHSYRRDRDKSGRNLSYVCLTPAK